MKTGINRQFRLVKRPFGEIEQSNDYLIGGLLEGTGEECREISLIS